MSEIRRFEIDIEVLCPECQKRGLRINMKKIDISTHAHPASIAMYCSTGGCPLFGRIFKPPVVEIVEMESIGDLDQ
jgi:hypothetical protein